MNLQPCASRIICDRNYEYFLAQLEVKVCLATNLIVKDQMHCACLDMAHKCVTHYWRLFFISC